MHKGSHIDELFERALSTRYAKYNFSSARGMNKRKAFNDLVETKDAVTGKPVTPLANADNVAMLQVSGTLANRWGCR